MKGFQGADRCRNFGELIVVEVKFTERDQFAERGGNFAELVAAYVQYAQATEVSDVFGQVTQRGFVEPNLLEGRDGCKAFGNAGDFIVARIDHFHSRSQAKPCRKFREVVARDVQEFEIGQAGEGGWQGADLIPLDFQGMEVAKLSNGFGQRLQVLVGKPEDEDFVLVGKGILQIGVNAGAGSLCVCAQRHHRQRNKQKTGGNPAKDVGS